MLNKHEGNLLLVSALVCIPMLLLQGILLAPPVSPLTLLLVMLTTITGFALLLFLSRSLHRGERERQEQRWLQALQQRDPAMLDSLQAQTTLRQLLASFNEAELDAHRQITELHNQATRDEMTGLCNRHAFRRDLTELLQQENTQTAILVLIRATELGKLNAQRGFQSGDAYIRDIAALITQTVSRFPGHQVYRISGADFAVLMPPLAQLPPHLLGRDLKLAFDNYQHINGLESAAYSGMTRLSSEQKIEAILARADMALARAQTEAVNGWAIQQNDEVVEVQGQRHWTQVLTELLEQENISFTCQSIQSLHRGMIAYHEIYPRFHSADGTVLPSDTLLAMAQRLDMVLRLAQMVVRHAIRQYRAFGGQSSRWGLNLPGTLLQSSAFLIWLDHQLQKDPDISANLVFEMDEDHLERNLTGAKRLFELLRRHGSRSAICNFGKGIGSFSLFRELKPDYIKLDPGLITELEQDLTNQQFVRMIVDVSHRMGCLVIAEGVEQVGQKQMLQSMYVDGLQGYLIAQPQEMGPEMVQQTLLTEHASASAGSE
ncbi:EAL domain-containing protein [Aeromonas taiwanensis]|uniref:EAL domain-containing protein n=1 Tax=Aeromonas taiwanensis TaxID=633417 RepID=UPI003BA10D85